MPKLRSTRLLTFTALLLVFSASCGGESGVAEETTSTAPTAADTTVADDDDGDPTGPGGVSLVCLEATQAMGAAMSAYGAGLAQATGGGLDDEALQEAAEQLQAMAGAAPAEIQDDMQVIADQLEDFYTALAEIGYEPGTTPSADQIAELSRITEEFDDEAFQEASDNITAWFDANC